MMASRTHHTVLSSLLFLTLLCVFPSLCDSMRYVNAHAIPLQDSYLDALPIRVQSVPSQIKCVELCTMETHCMSINYFKDKTCQLLKNFVCDGLMVLLSRPGARHFDVEFGRTIQEINYYTNHNDCSISLNRCSPKCKDCTLGSTFVNIDAGRLVGDNLNVYFFKSIPQCEQICSSDPQCRSVERTSTFCYVAALTRDMMHPDAFEHDAGYYYAERICS